MEKTLWRLGPPTKFFPHGTKTLSEIHEVFPYGKNFVAAATSLQTLADARQSLLGLVECLFGSLSGALRGPSGSRLSLVGRPVGSLVGEPCRVTRRAASGRAGAFGRVICPSAACLSLDVFGCNADRKSSGRRHGAPIIINYIDSCSGHQLLSTFHHVFCERMCTHTNTVKSHGTVITLSRAASCRGRFRGREG